MHQAYRQWGIADGNDITPMEVDALMKGKGKNKGKGKGKEKGKDKGKGKSKDQGEGRNIRHVGYEVFPLQGKRPHPERIAPSSRPASLRRRQSVTSRVQTPLRKTDGSSPWIRRMRSYAS